jgi:hercynylcysteine S-oxide lyase
MSALEFRNWLGGEAKINAYCHEMAVKGGKRLAEIFGTRVMDPEGDLTVNMVRLMHSPSFFLP